MAIEKNHYVRQESSRQNEDRSKTDHTLDEVKTPVKTWTLLIQVCKEIRAPNSILTELPGIINPHPESALPQR
jgi:hypothetical protein